MVSAQPLYSAHFPIIADDLTSFAPEGRAKPRGDFAMATAAPLMPKATAVWLLDNTALSFDQIADFCKLHPLEVKAIADGDAAQGIKGLDPIGTGQLTPRADRGGRGQPGHPADAHPAQGHRPHARARQQGPALYAGVAPPGPPERDPLAGAQPSRAQGQPDHAAGRHHQVDHRLDPRPHALEFGHAVADGPGDARPVLADRPRPRSLPRQQGKAGRRSTPAPRCCRLPRPRARKPSRRLPTRPRRKRPAISMSAPCSPSSSSSAARAAAPTRTTSKSRGPRILRGCARHP